MSLKSNSELKIFYYMIITWINEISNVWANDAAKVSVLIFLFSLPFISYIFFLLSKKSFLPIDFNRNFIKINFLIILLINMFSLAGPGQIVYPSFIDALTRSFGIFVYLIALLLYVIFDYYAAGFKKKFGLYESAAFKATRNPDIFLLFSIASGSSLLSASFFGIILSLFLFLPVIIIKLKSEEKQLLKSYKEYYDIKNNIPLLFPDFIKILKRFFYGKIKRI